MRAEYDDTPELDCPGLVRDGVFTEPFSPVPIATVGLWFEDFYGGDFHLRPDAPASILAVMGSIATWSSGDPMTDIDGEPRLGEEGLPTFVGADVP